MIRIVDGNLLDADVDVICHQVNCQGKMGSGVAKQIREKWPVVYRAYSEFCHCFKKDQTNRMLGHCLMVQIRPYSSGILPLYVMNLFAQDRYGYDGTQYTDVEAFRQCIDRLAKYCVEMGWHTVAMPYKIGCGRGGADWNVIYKIIEDGLRDFDVTLFKYEE